PQTLGSAMPGFCTPARWPQGKANPEPLSQYSRLKAGCCPPILPGKAVDHGEPRHRTAAVFFEPMSKRRRGFPSETQVKRGVRSVHGGKELVERLGRNDLPLRVGQALQEVLPQHRLLL